MKRPLQGRKLRIFKFFDMLLSHRILQMPVFLLLILGVATVRAQETLPLNDLGFWKAGEGKNWRVASDATVDLNHHDRMNEAAGTGVLVNIPDDKNRSNLLSVNEYGDVDVSFDFMMAVHSNSGFYLQGRYEVQLMDSWGVQKPTFADCGGIFARRRWNPQEQLFDGVPPRVNACLAPGLWQHMEISFQAPRFDASGKKTENAKLLKVVLNGAILHENLELTGPTGGPISEQEAATGPFMIQGDHGPVAFRNFQIKSKQGAQVTGGPFSYQVIYGAFRNVSEFAGKKADLEGKTPQLTWEVAKKEDEYAIIFKGNIAVPEAGKYRITLQNSGRALLFINGNEVFPFKWTFTTDQRSAEVDLPAGTAALELTVAKMDGWMSPYIGLWVEGPGSRPASLHSFSSTLAQTPSDPIGLKADKPVVFRSFMDVTLPRFPNATEYQNKPNFFPETGKKRIVHAVQVGDPTHLHYTFDLDNGAVAQVWKGGFLNTSPMWDNRGDGSSQPQGAVLALDDVSMIVSKANMFEWKPSITEPIEQYRPHGYDLDDKGTPVFRYQRLGMEVEDHLEVADGKTLSRNLKIANIPSDNDFICRIAFGSKIDRVDNNTWSIDGKRYYIQLEEGAQPQVARSGDLSVLYVPVSSGVSYRLMW